MLQRPKAGDSEAPDPPSTPPKPATAPCASPRTRPGENPAGGGKRRLPHHHPRSEPERGRDAAGTARGSARGCGGRTLPPPAAVTPHGPGIEEGHTHARTDGQTDAPPAPPAPAGGKFGFPSPYLPLPGHRALAEQLSAGGRSRTPYIGGGGPPIGGGTGTARPGPRRGGRGDGAPRCTPGGGVEHAGGLP